MKKTLVFSAIFILAIALCSCSKNTTASTSYGMDADINSIHFSATGSANVVATVITNPSDATKKQLTIVGTSATKHIIITIGNYTVSQTVYPIDLTGNGAIAVWSSGSGPDLIANSGSLTVTKSGTSYQGSFNFANSGSGLSVVNGTFVAAGN